MARRVYKPGSFEANLFNQSTLENVQWEVSQTNLNLVATKEALEQHGVRVVDALEQQGERVEEGLRDVSQRLDTLDRTFVEGVITLHADLLAIEGSVHDLTAKFDWGITRLEAALGGLGDSLQNLIQLAETPEQTWALEQYRTALNAFERNLFPESLEHVERAINGFEGHTGYKIEHRFHRLLGLILRTESEIQNLPGAQTAYLTAARYAGDKNKWDAALALMAAGYVAYKQGNSQEAIELTKRALTLADITEAKFNLAKFLMHRNEVAPALEWLGKAIEVDPIYSVKCLADPDFLRHEPDVQSALGQWSDILLAKCERLQGAVTAALLEMKSGAIADVRAVHASKHALTTGARFANIDSYPSLEHDAQVPALLGSHAKLPYLDLRLAFDRRDELLQRASAVATDYTRGIDSIRTMMAAELAKNAYWQDDSVALGVVRAIFALPFVSVIALLALFPSLRSISIEHVGIFLVAVIPLTIFSPLIGASISKKRATRVNELAQSLVERLTKTRAVLDAKMNDLKRLFDLPGLDAARRPEGGRRRALSEEARRSLEGMDKEGLRDRYWKLEKRQEEIASVRSAHEAEQRANTSMGADQRRLFTERLATLRAEADVAREEQELVVQILFRDVDRAIASRNSGEK